MYTVLAIIKLIYDEILTRWALAAADVVGSGPLFPGDSPVGEKRGDLSRQFLGLASS